MNALEEKLLAIQHLVAQSDALLKRKQFAKSEAKLVAAYKIYDELKTCKKQPEQSVTTETPPDCAAQASPSERLPSYFEAAETAVRSFLEANLFGQPDAIEAGVHAYLQSMATIKRPDQPLCITMALGRSRTGKSELPRLLAQFLHGDRRALVRVDLSQYREDHQIATLIGSPPGYVGYKDPAKFSRETLEKSRAGSKNKQIILVLEEFEKAHPVVADVLLGLFDNGELELASGETVDFRDVMIFMTSNLAAKELSQLGKTFVGFSARNQAPSDKQILSEVNRMLAKHYRPEFVNRLDRIVIYRDLDEDSIRKILHREIAWLAAEVKRTTKSILVLEDSAEHAIIQTAMAKAEFADDDSGAGSAVAEIKRIISQQLIKKVNGAIAAKKPCDNSKLVARCTGTSPDEIELSLENITIALPPESTPTQPPNRVKSSQRASEHLFRATVNLLSQLQPRNRDTRSITLCRLACNLSLSTLPADEVVPPLLVAAESYIKDRNFATAEACLKLCEDRSIELKNPADRLPTAALAATYWQSRQKWRIALTKLRSLLELQRTAGGGKQDQASTLLRIGICLTQSRKYSEALTELQKAIHLTMEPDQRAVIFCRMAEVHRALDQLQQASDLIKQADSELHSDKRCTESHIVLLEERCALSYAENHYAEAKVGYTQALALRNSLNGEDSIEAAAIKARIAMCEFSLRRNDAAAVLLEESARTYKRHRCIRTASGATILAKLSGIYKLQGRLIESTAIADGIEEIEAEVGTGNPPSYIALYEQALQAQYDENFESAQSIYLQLLELTRTAQAELTPETPAIYLRLHQVSEARKSLAEAELHLVRAQVVLRELFGCRRDVDLISGAIRLAEAFSIQAKDTWADAFYALALKFADRYGTLSQQADVCSQYAHFLENSERHVEALQLKSRATRLRRKRKKRKPEPSMIV